MSLVRARTEANLIFLHALKCAIFPYYILFNLSNSLTFYNISLPNQNL